MYHLLIQVWSGGVDGVIRSPSHFPRFRAATIQLVPFDHVEQYVSFFFFVFFLDQVRGRKRERQSRRESRRDHGDVLCNLWTGIKALVFSIIRSVAALSPFRGETAALHCRHSVHSFLDFYWAIWMIYIPHLLTLNENRSNGIFRWRWWWNNWKWRQD